MSLIALTGQPQLILRFIWLIRLIRPIGLIWPIGLIGLIGLIDNQTLKRKCMMSPSCTT